MIAMTVTEPHRSLALPAALRAAVMAVSVAVFCIVALIAIGSGVGRIALPFEMWLVDQRLPVVFRLHMVASGLALLVLPLAIAVRHRPRLHRRIGWLLGAFVVAAGLSSIPVAMFSTSSLPARAGFFVQGLVWMGLLWAALAAIRNGERERHAILMLAMAAVTTGAVWFRIMTGCAIALEGPFETIYALAAWAGWLVPLALVAGLRHRLTAWAFATRPPPLARAPAIV